MSQYTNNPLQNTCDLSQTSNNLSLNLDNIGLAAKTFIHAELSITEKNKSLNQIRAFRPTDSDDSPKPKIRHVDSKIDAKNTVSEKCQICGETPCYSHFHPDENTVLLPLVVRSLVTAKEWENTYMPVEQQNRYLESYGQICKQQDIFTLERKQRAQFHRTSGRTARYLGYEEPFFDKKVKPCPYLQPSPSPSLPCSLRSGGVEGVDNMSHISSQADPLTNEPYLENLQKSPKIKDILEVGYLPKAKEIPQKVSDLIQEVKQNHNATTKTLDFHKNPDELLLTVELNPAYMRFKVESEESAHYGRNLKRDVQKYGGKRKCITELSPRSRHRLFEKSLNWELLGYDPQFMQTITMPGKYESLNISGPELKYIFTKYRKNVGNWLKRRGYTNQKAMWILEFQKRGAPHFHVIFCDVGMDKKTQIEFNSMCSKVWAELVGHPDPVEYKKHLERGVQYEELLNKDLRYLRAYMSKQYQKTVPEGYEGVGRFWGAWWEPKLSAITFTVRVSDQIVAAIKEMALIKYKDLSHKIARRVHKGMADRFAPDSLARSFAHKLYGGDVSSWFLDVIPLFEVRDGEKIPDDALARADEKTKEYWWADDDWEKWLQAHRGVLIGQLYTS